MKKDRKKTDKIIIFTVIFLFLFSSFTVEAGYELGQFWSLNDNTIVQTNISHNVNIGENDTSDFKLNINGSFNVDSKITNLHTLFVESGFVGINTNVPSVDFDVIGNTTITGDFIVDTDSDNDLIYVSDNKVGIGTSTRTQTLTVDGSIASKKIYLDDSGSGEIYIDGLTGNVWVDFIPSFFGLNTITFPSGTYDIIGTNTGKQTIYGQKSFIDDSIYFAHYLKHQNEATNYISFTTKHVTISNRLVMGELVFPTSLPNEPFVDGQVWWSKSNSTLLIFNGDTLNWVEK